MSGGPVGDLYVPNMVVVGAVMVDVVSWTSEREEAVSSKGS